MGRDLVRINENEWWIVETVSNYFSRCSKPFESKEEAIETLRKGGCPEWIVSEFEEHEHVSSIGKAPFGMGFVSCGVEISKALDKMDAICPDGGHSLYWDVECARDGCTAETVNWDGDESICGDCEEAQED